MAITIKDVAKRAGVSISTVSRVINNSKPVSSDIRQRVMAVIEETGYVPNTVARSLVTKKSQIIGVIVPDMSNIFIGELLNGIEEVGKMYGYDILLCNSYGGADEELRYINLLQSKQVAGIIFVSWRIDDKHVQTIKNTGLPCVYISKNAKDFDVYSVGIDYYKAAYDMTNYLLARGHKSIAFLRSRFEYTNEESDRFNAFKNALAEHGLEMDYDMVKAGHITSEAGYNMMCEILDSGSLPDAVFTTNDEIAAGAINCILDRGLRVPEDISVAGFDDTRVAMLVRPTITTIRQPIYDIGAVSIRMIIKMIKKEAVDTKVVDLPYELVERKSVK